MTSNSKKFNSLATTAGYAIQNDVASGNSVMYVTIGKESPWDNDSNPDQVQTTIHQEFEMWDNMIGGKRVEGSDLSFIIPRINWEANLVFTMYDDRSNSLYDLANSNGMYVLSSAGRVYKCLFNNYGANSTIEPTTSSNTYNQTTLDGYVWKYMYDMSSYFIQKFLTDEWMPVKTLKLNDGSDQWAIQQNAIDGGLDTILILNAGQSYSNLANLVVTIQGDGIGAQATVNTNTTNSIVTAIFTQPGVNYTRANLIVTDLSSPPGFGAAFKVIIPPKGGHGSDAVKELGATALMIDVQLNEDETGQLPTSSEFRQIALIKNPKISGGSSNIATNTAFSQTTQLTLAGSGADYILGELVYQGPSQIATTFSGIVVTWDSGNSAILLTNVTGSVDTSLLIGADSAAGRFVTSVVGPDFVPFSGDLLYLDHITPVQRDPKQTEDIKIAVVL